MNEAATMTMEEFIAKYSYQDSLNFFEMMGIAFIVIIGLVIAIALIYYIIKYWDQLKFVAKPYNDDDDDDYYRYAPKRTSRTRRKHRR